MATRPRINPTPEQLQAAWERRRRRHWPDGFDAAMADPLLSRLVHMEAVLAVLRAERDRARLAHPFVDRKRLAARDFDCDD